MCLSRRLSSAVNLIVECMHWNEKVFVTFECGVMRLWCCSLAAGFELGSSNWKSEIEFYQNDSHSQVTFSICQTRVGRYATGSDLGVARGGRDSSRRGDFLC